MGSALKLTFGNLTNSKTKIFNAANNPCIYPPYINDIFLRDINRNDPHDLQKKKKFQNNSVLNLSYQLNTIYMLSFLNDLIVLNNTFTTFLYQKATSTNSFTLI